MSFAESPGGRTNRVLGAAHETSCVGVFESTSNNNQNYPHLLKQKTDNFERSKGRLGSTGYAAACAVVQRIDRGLPSRAFGDGGQ